ncbi:MAG: NADH dehydrogenase [Elusimicrobia bacterium]|nr:NADH dehydrogenase [Elusimicrobiota bacterium]
MNILLYPIFLPIVIGLIILLIGSRNLQVASFNRRINPAATKTISLLSLITALIVLVLGFAIFSAGELNYSVPWISYGIDFSLRAYAFSSFCVLFASFFAFLICLYSMKAERHSAATYYSFILINLGVVNGAFLSNNFIIFILFWELAAVMLYLLIRIGNGNSYETATKALYIIGFSDFCLLLGIVLLWNITGRFDIIHYSLPVTRYSLLAFILMTIGAMAKAGAMPFHTWIPDASKDASIEVMAYLPASLDKLLGIYLLARICTDFFTLSLSHSLTLLLCSFGAFTIIAAVFMALIQTNMKKLIAYMNISGAGYMILGIGTNNSIGIAGGLFYMLSTALWTSCLFLCAGSVEHKTGTTDLDKLGGLSKAMPLTFVATFIAALSISGVPPFNGFFSKWMIYQGLIQQLPTSASPQALPIILFLVIAMFGSALTLASFIKVIHSVFLGQSSKVVAQFIEPDKSGNYKSKPTEVPWTLWFPTVILACLCVIFGVFAYQVPLKYFVFPSLPSTFIGVWQPSLATLLIIAGIIIGVIIYFLGTIKTIRKAETYIYGEDPEIFQQNVRGTEFYLTISDAKPFSSIYKKAEAQVFDFYNWAFGSAKAIANTFFICIDRMLENIYIGIDHLTKIVSTFISELQGGLLQIYLYWSLLGLLILLLLLGPKRL